MSLKTNPSAKLPKFAPSKDGLADILGVSRSTVMRASVIDGCPKAAANGQHNVEKWKAFLAKHFDVLNNEASGAAVPDGFATWKEFGEAQTGMRNAVKLAKERNQVADKPFVSQVIARAFSRLHGIQQRVFGSELPAQLAGLDAVTIEVKLKAAITETLEEFRKDVSTWDQPI